MSKHPETDAMERVQFEGRTCIVVAPEDIEQLETERNEAEAALLDAEELLLFISEPSWKRNHAAAITRARKGER